VADKFEIKELKKTDPIPYDLLLLAEFAFHLKADPNLISFILNNHLHNNFYDFVNAYRIEEVKNKLNDPALKYLTLLGIALDSGFNSKTTFNRVFRQVTGITPTEFQKKKKITPPE
jgi:AraC-like DNA-binding protein